MQIRDVRKCHPLNYGRETPSRAVDSTSGRHRVNSNPANDGPNSVAWPADGQTAVTERGQKFSSSANDELGFVCYSGIRQRHFFRERVEYRFDLFVGMVPDDSGSVLEIDDAVVC